MLLLGSVLISFQLHTFSVKRIDEQQHQQQERKKKEEIFYRTNREC